MDLFRWFLNTTTIFLGCVIQWSGEFQLENELNTNLNRVENLTELIAVIDLYFKVRNFIKLLYFSLTVQFFVYLGPFTG